VTPAPPAGEIAPALECVPNVSEGRDRYRLRRLAETVTAAGARLADLHHDVDHHRSVFTFFGAPETVERAALAFALLAVELIDLRTHAGVHPRIGALDVMPFVPLAGSPMTDAIAVAHRVGRALAAETNVPVFFYEEAAIVPGRRDLPELRVGGFEGLAERMRDQRWHPDAGPAAPHPTAGASVIGARRPLIALNAMLHSDDLAGARAVAAAIRERTPGGLAAVRALGVMLPSRGIAQVSMNLLDYRRTSARVVMDRLDAEAALRGFRVSHYELVGCAPADALDDAARARIPELQPSQLLDARWF
jgi:glutamate formiminotransferase / 5-formyltetrahydrofolate cyclo-ligase